MKGWKNFILAGLLICAVGASISIAQNINRALQLSQDPLGQFGVDSNNNVYFPGHVLVRPTQAPVVSSCGTSPSNSGSDFAGTVTEGTTSTGCVITFNQVYLTAPFCVTQQRTFTTASPISRQLFVTGILITHAAMATGATMAYDYFCSGTR
jgi:hypothetical protein